MRRCGRRQQSFNRLVAGIGNGSGRLHGLGTKYADADDSVVCLTVRETERVVATLEFLIALSWTAKLGVVARISRWKFKKRNGDAVEFEQRRYSKWPIERNARSRRSLDVQLVPLLLPHRLRFRTSGLLCNSSIHSQLFTYLHLSI